ncbi:MAG: hypothetical protein O3B09_04205, partial [Proteobacteria bacterium]|nr:hypothetical protein [Pseudomonadota bacterium]
HYDDELDLSSVLVGEKEFERIIDDLVEDRIQLSHHFLNRVNLLINKGVIDYITFTTDSSEKTQLKEVAKKEFIRIKSLQDRDYSKNPSALATAGIAAALVYNNCINQLGDILEVNRDAAIEAAANYAARAVAAGIDPQTALSEANRVAAYRVNQRASNGIANGEAAIAAMDETYEKTLAEYQNSPDKYKIAYAAAQASFNAYYAAAYHSASGNAVDISNGSDKLAAKIAALAVASGIGHEQALKDAAAIAAKQQADQSVAINLGVKIDDLNIDSAIDSQSSEDLWESAGKLESMNNQVKYAIFKAVSDAISAGANKDEAQKIADHVNNAIKAGLTIEQALGFADVIISPKKFNSSDGSVMVPPPFPVNPAIIRNAAALAAQEFYDKNLSHGDACAYLAAQAAVNATITSYNSNNSYQQNNVDKAVQHAVMAYNLLIAENNANAMAIALEAAALYARVVDSTEKEKLIEEAYKKGSYNKKGQGPKIGYAAAHAVLVALDNGVDTKRLSNIQKAAKKAIEQDSYISIDVAVAQAVAKNPKIAKVKDVQLTPDPDVRRINDVEQMDQRYIAASFQPYNREGNILTAQVVHGAVADLSPNQASQKLAFAVSGGELDKLTLRKVITSKESMAAFLKTAQSTDPTSIRLKTLEIIGGDSFDIPVADFHDYLLKSGPDSLVLEDVSFDIVEASIKAVQEEGCPVKNLGINGGAESFITITPELARNLAKNDHLTGLHLQNVGFGIIGMQAFAQEFDSFVASKESNLESLAFIDDAQKGDECYIVVTPFAAECLRNAIHSTNSKVKKLHLENIEEVDNNDTPKALQILIQGCYDYDGSHKNSQISEVIFRNMGHKKLPLITKDVLDELSKAVTTEGNNIEVIDLEGSQGVDRTEFAKFVSNIVRKSTHGKVKTLNLGGITDKNGDLIELEDREVEIIAAHLMKSEVE